ncbi:MAG: spheroidene monooxygenase [Acidimicrobiales bacterium]
MLGSVHLLDGGVRTTVRCLRRAPTPSDTPGLRHARAVVAAPLGGSIAAPQPSRFGLIAFWDDAGALDQFLDTHPLAEVLAGGWSVRLEPLRAVPVASGHFPGVPDDLPTGPIIGHDGPTAVLTIGRLRVRRVVSFRRTSSRAERQVAEAPGVLWATGLANVPQRVVSTFSLWRTGTAMRAYATSTSGHSEAIRTERSRSFHHAGSFIRFRPHAAGGVLPGRNPLPEGVTALVNHG